MKNYLALTALLLLVSRNAYAAQIPIKCDDFSISMTKQIIGIFHDTKQSESQKRDMLSKLFLEAVDTNWIGKFVLGRFWNTSTSDEQTQYLANYRAYITHNYISKFTDEDGMSVDDIVVTSLTPKDAHHYDAKTLIKRNGEEDVKVDYLLDDTSGTCQVHDIKVEGVSLLASQRSEFSALANSSGVKGVIEALKKQISH